LECDISHIASCTINIQHVVGRVCYTNVASAEQRCPWGACLQWVLQEDQVHELQAVVFSGNAIRIRSHYIKCTACPEDIRDWARGAAKRAKEIRKHKDLAKNLDSKLQGDDDCATQQRIDEGLLGKKKTSRSLVDEKFAAWIYNTMQSFDVTADFFAQLH
jgi:hypothetical protein